MIVLCHIPIAPGSAGDNCLVWNYEDCLRLLQRFHHVVVAVLSGHDHDGGYTRDETGIHFKTFESPLQAEDQNAFAIVEVHPNQIAVKGYGTVGSAIWDF